MPKVSTQRWNMAFGRLSVGIVFLAGILPLFFVSQAFCFVRPKDFRGLKWGTEISQIEGLVLHPNQTAPDSKRYTRPSDSLEIAGGKVDAIDYWFANNRLTRVVLHFKAVEQFYKMKSVFLNLYGPPDKQKEDDGKRSRVITNEYTWYASSDDEANVYLLYSYQILSGNKPLEIVGARMEWKGGVKDKSGL
jgi:hypothetical protein